MIKVTNIKGQESFWKFETIAEFIKEHANSGIVNWEVIIKIEKI